MIFLGVIWQLLSDIPVYWRFLFVCYSSVILLFRCFSFFVAVFSSVLVFDPYLFSLNMIVTIEQGYTTVGLFIGN